MARTAIVTGGGTGIGRAVAKKLVDEGAEVVLLGRRADVLSETAKEIGAAAVAVDAGDPAAVRAALAEAGTAEPPCRSGC
jgi:3-oxoacyl-[acyl-carrier protein] reductase